MFSYFGEFCLNENSNDTGDDSNIYNPYEYDDIDLINWLALAISWADHMTRTKCNIIIVKKLFIIIYN